MLIFKLLIFKIEENLGLDTLAERIIVRKKDSNDIHLLSKVCILFLNLSIHSFSSDGINGYGNNSCRISRSRIYSSAFILLFSWISIFHYWNYLMIMLHHILIYSHQLNIKLAQHLLIFYRNIFPWEILINIYKKFETKINHLIIKLD